MAKEKAKQVQSIPDAIVYVICVVIVAVVSIVGYMAVYLPAVDKLSHSRAQLREKEAAYDSLKAQEDEYNVFRKENERLEARLAILQDKIPSTTNELNHFLDSVNQRARSSRITNWTLFKQEGIVADGEVSRIPIRMEFTSPYDAAIQFFWDLASMGDGGRGGNREQLINISDLNITRENARAEGTEPQVKVICVAETYLYTGKADAAGKKAK